MAHRATVDKARQPAAKPVLKSSEGWEIPCQPRLNSSINFIIGLVTSCDQRIQNKAEPRGKRIFRDARSPPGGLLRAAGMELARLRCSRRAGILIEPLS